MLRAGRALQRAAACGRRGQAAALSTHLPLILNDDEAMFKEAVAGFAAAEVAPLVAEMDRASTMDEGLLASLFANGFMGVEVEERFGGSGASFTSMCCVIEELAKVDPAVSTCVDVHSTVVNNTIAFWGSEALKAHWLPKLATDTVGSFCLSEPGSGSDAFALRTKAEKRGDRWVLNGEKAWITNAEHAGVFLVFANADPAKGYKGITCFAVPADAAGLAVGAKEDKLGIRASSTCPVVLEDVEVGDDAVLGDVGQGYKYAIGILNEGRIGIGAQMVGLAQGALDATMPYLFERSQFGTKIGDFQGMQLQRVPPARFFFFSFFRRLGATHRPRGAGTRTSRRSSRPRGSSSSTRRAARRRGCPSSPRRPWPSSRRRASPSSPRPSASSGWAASAS